jgi:hypothetical protein
VELAAQRIQAAVVEEDWRASAPGSAFLRCSGSRLPSHFPAWCFQAKEEAGKWQPVDRGFAFPGSPAYCLKHYWTGGPLSVPRELCQSRRRHRTRWTNQWQRRTQTMSRGQLLKGPVFSFESLTRDSISEAVCSRNAEPCRFQTSPTVTKSCIPGCVSAFSLCPPD